MGRIERVLWRIGLLPNSAKTALITKDEFHKQHHVDENEYLDQVHDLTEQGLSLTAGQRQEFESRVSGFLQSEQMGYWSRVLRRYYSESRRLRSKRLLGTWGEHLDRFPSEAKHILDYVSSFAGTFDLARRTFNFIRQHDALNDDVQILLYEMLLIVPFPNDAIIRSFVARQTLYHCMGIQGFQPPRQGYVRGLQALVIFKFGRSAAMGSIAKEFATPSRLSPEYALHALPALAGRRVYRDMALQAVENVVDPRIVRLRSLIRRLESGEMEAIGRLVGFLNPKQTKFPMRAIVNARALPLIRIARRTGSPGAKQKIDLAISNISQKIRSTGSPDLVDSITLSHL